VINLRQDVTALIKELDEPFGVRPVLKAIPEVDVEVTFASSSSSLTPELSRLSTEGTS